MCDPTIAAMFGGVEARGLMKGENLQCSFFRRFSLITSLVDHDCGSPCQRMIPGCGYCFRGRAKPSFWFGGAIRAILTCSAWSVSSTVKQCLNGVGGRKTAQTSLKCPKCNYVQGVRWKGPQCGYQSVLDATWTGDGFDVGGKHFLELIFGKPHGNSAKNSGKTAIVFHEIDPTGSNPDVHVSNRRTFGCRADTINQPVLHQIHDICPYLAFRDVFKLLHRVRHAVRVKLLEAIKDVALERSVNHGRKSAFSILPANVRFVEGVSQFSQVALWSRRYANV